MKLRPYVKASYALNAKGTGADFTITVNTRHPLFWIDRLRVRLAYLITPGCIREERGG